MSPPQPPSAIESMPERMMRVVFIDVMVWYRIARGASFCQVSRIIPDESLIPCVTSGTQKWKGARPSFIIIDARIMFEASGLCSSWVDSCPECKKFIKMAIIRIIEAVT